LLKYVIAVCALVPALSPLGTNAILYEVPFHQYITPVRRGNAGAVYVEDVNVIVKLPPDTATAVTFDAHVLTPPAEGGCSHDVVPVSIAPVNVFSFIILYATAAPPPLGGAHSVS
jgi:hypothetical protein